MELALVINPSKHHTIDTSVDDTTFMLGWFSGLLFRIGRKCKYILTI